MLSYKEFMNEVKKQLNAFSEEELQKAILTWASEVPPTKREEFLDRLQPKQDIEDSLYDEESLIHEIEGFGVRVENGDFFDGYGWDYEIHDERAYGDESWMEEVAEFLLEIREMMLRGNTEAAEEAYRKLFDIVDMGMESDYLPGDVDLADMLEVDVNEQVTLFLRAVYVNASPGERVNAFYEAMENYRYFARSQLKLIDIRDVLDTELPDFDIFLKESIDFLKDFRTFYSGDLLREAVFLKGGIPALSIFAKEHADTYPAAYLDWIQKLENGGHPDGEIVKVAKEGLSNIPVDFIVRAQIAATLVKIGEKLQNDDLKLEGHKECFLSKPTMEHLVDLYAIAIKHGCLDAVQNEAVKRLKQLQKTGDTGRNILPERNTSGFSDRVYANALLLAGQHEKIFELCKGKGPVGWSSYDNPKFIFVAFMLVLLSKKRIDSSVLEQQLIEATAGIDYDSDNSYVKQYRKVMDHILPLSELSAEQEEFYLNWCKEQTGKRVDAIVSNQYRGSYHKAARLLVAVAETMANRGNRQEGLSFIEKYKKKYPRHVAFKREITEAFNHSSLS
ncbi:hypothetical protein [Siminovitchia sp. 179-K 8D1 HS]|uniref:hypothetical protein n=1 Tax=Siminovitchia sp. 179-K 8D1 HS TaxID=3142385 RepID=UPI0039A2FE53